MVQESIGIYLRHRKPLKVEHDGSVDVKTLTSVARAEELFSSNLGCQLWGTSNIMGYLLHFRRV